MLERENVRSRDRERKREREREYCFTISRVWFVLAVPLLVEKDN